MTRGSQRDLFEIKLKKKDLTCWRDTPEVRACGKDYDKAITYLKGEFLGKNKNQLERQVYVHATCATDTKNVQFVFTAVVGIILEENLKSSGLA